MSSIKKLFRILDRKTKWRLLLLLAAIIFGAFLEMLTIAMIAPLISVLLDEAAVYDNAIISFFYERLGFSSPVAFMAFIAFVMAGLYVLRGFYIFWLNKVKFVFIARRRATLSEKLLNKILSFSYLYHTKKNLADLQRNVLQDAETLLATVLTALTLATDFFTAVFILALLITQAPLMTVIVLGTTALMAIAFVRVFRSKLRKLSVKNRDANIGMAKSVIQPLGGIKEIKVLRRESYFEKVFNHYVSVFVDVNTRHQVLSFIPKAVIETICFGGGLLLVGLMVLGGADIAVLAPQLALFAMAAFRMLPSITRIVSQINAIMYGTAPIDAVYKSLYEETDVETALPCEPELMNEPPDYISVRSVTFQYPGINEPVLTDTRFDIPEKKTVGLVGSSGAGKTTLADIILGVLSPNAGGVFYKGKSIHHNFSEWSKDVGYIPQQIYLLDESIRANVAFGIEPELIDEAKVWRALEQAQLKDFVLSLTDGIETIVGDRGVRLSGGQRQRVGIARAMYEDPPILVMDEATSSLDNETEKAVMDAIMSFKGNKTMLIIAHRLSTIENCDIIYRVENRTVTQER